MSLSGSSMDAIVGAGYYMYMYVMAGRSLRTRAFCKA